MKAKNHGSVLVNVIGILAVCILVAAIFIAMFANSREQSNTRFSCQSNLKECAIAIHLYANDYDGCLPSSALVRHSKKWNKRDFLTFATKRGKFSPFLDNRRTWSELVHDYMYNKDVMFCPSDTTSRDNPHAKVSYWWKLAIDKAWYGEGCTKAYRKLDDFTYNPDQVILYERNGWHCGDTDGLKNGSQINVAFLDTHIKTITIKNATSGDPINCAANSDGEPMYFNYDMKKDARLTDEKTPAKFVDPGRYSDDY